MKISQIVQEAPIEDFQLIGNFNKSSSFRKEPDRRLLTNPRYVERIKNMFANTGFDFRMWFVNSPEANRYTEVGEVTVEWLEDNMPNTVNEIDNHDTVAQNRSFGRDAINIMYTNNKGVGWRPMTGWIIAHRMAHVILKPNFRNFNAGQNDPTQLIDRDAWPKFEYIMQLYGVNLRHGGAGGYMARRELRYEYNRNPMFRRFLSAIGTMRSARDNNLLNWYEFMYECFAQYLLKGAVTLNPAPPNLILSYAYGRPQNSRTLDGAAQSEANYAISYIADAMEQEFESALHGAVGRIFVM